MGAADHVAVVIPFRDRGRDPLRASNLERVAKHWVDFDAPVVVADDGRTGDAQFNRSAAYNRGRRLVGDPDVIVYAESDMLLDHEQVREAVRLAAAEPGVVVPFTEYHYLSEADSRWVRSMTMRPGECVAESVRSDGQSIGAVNVISRATLNAVGQWDEAFEGSWYDDTAMMRAFEVAAGPTRWVTGAAWHLYHLPGWTGNHLTAVDRAATAANLARCKRYMNAHTAEEIRALTCG